MSLAVAVRYKRPYYILWTARVVSFFGDTLAQVTLMLVAARQSRPALAVSLLLVAQTLPQLLGPVAGLLSDRAAPRRLMVSCELGQGALVTAIALVALPFAVVLALVAGMATLATFFQPAGLSALPALVARDDLGDANALLRVGFNLSRAAGPPLAGLLAVFSGATPILLLDGLTFAISAALLRLLPRLRQPSTAADPPIGAVASARAGWSYIRRHTTARAVIIGLFLVTLFVALDNVGLVFLSERTLRTGGAGYGLLLAGYGVGMICGPLILLRLGRHASPAATLLVGCAVMGLGTLLCGLAPALVVAIVCQWIVGLGNGWQNVANDTLIQQTVPQELLGRVFGVVYSAPYAALLITYLAGGLLLTLTSPRVVFVVAGAGTVVATALIRLLLARPDRS